MAIVGGACGKPPGSVLLTAASEKKKKKKGEKKYFVKERHAPYMRIVMVVPDV